MFKKKFNQLSIKLFIAATSFKPKNRNAQNSPYAPCFKIL